MTPVVPEKSTLGIVKVGPRTAIRCNRDSRGRFGAPSQPCIFVVDDEEVIASTLTTILRSKGGFHATSFTDPLKALRAAHAEVPDLLITDVVMPQMSGIDLAIQLREVCPECKVLLFSGQAATADLLGAAQDAGYTFEVLLKPVHPANLLARIRTLTEGVQTLSPQALRFGI